MTPLSDHPPPIEWGRPAPPSLAGLALRWAATLALLATSLASALLGLDWLVGP